MAKLELKSEAIRKPRQTFLSRFSFAILLFLIVSALLLNACTFPTRMGYDRRTGSYKTVSKAASVQSNKPPQTKPAAEKKTSTDSKAAAPAPKVSTAPAPQKNVKPAGKKYATLKEYTDSWKGTKYVYGGSTRKGTDCSGYIINVYRDFYGVNLPHKASMIYDDERFTKVSRSDLKEGDLVFFGDFWGISHIGIYLGNNIFSHASTSRGVVTDNLTAKYYDSRYKGARRLKK